MKYMDFESMPLVLGVNDICDTLSIGRNKGYELIKSGQIQAIRIEKHFRIPRMSLLILSKKERRPHNS